MRFMMLMIPKGYEKAAPGTMPDAKAVAAMMQFVGWARFFSPTLFAECWADKALAQPTRFDPNKENAKRASRAEIVAAMQ